MRNLKLTKLKSTSPFRKVAMGTWKTAADPSVYGLVEIDMTKTFEALDKRTNKREVKVTPGHLVGAAIARCMKERPEINGMIRGNRIYLRDSVTLFYQVNIPSDGKDKVAGATLSGCTIENAEQMNSCEISMLLREKAALIRNKKDKEIQSQLQLFKILPWCLSRLYLNLGSFLIYGLNLNLKFLGLPRDPFGSVMITNVGSLGAEVALAPLCPYTRVPLLLSVGAVREKPIVVEGKVAVRPVLSVGCTFDHRLIDGIHASEMLKTFKKCFEEPESYLL